MSDIEKLFQHCLISLIAIAAHEENTFTYEDPSLTASQYESLLKEIESMRDSILSRVYYEGEDSITFNDLPAPLLQETQQTFNKCLKKFIYMKYQ